MNLVTIIAVGEAITGIAVLVAPAILRVVFGSAPVGIAIPVARVTGIALVGLGTGCFPGPATLGLAIFNGLVTLYLLDLGIQGEWVGSFLWPAVLIHAVLTVLFARAAHVAMRSTHSRSVSA